MSAILCSVLSAAVVGIIPGGIPGGVPIPVPPTPTITTKPIPIQRNGAVLPSFDEPPAGQDIAVGTIGSFGPLPGFMEASTPYIPTATFREDQGFKLDCQSSGMGETLPCVYYVVFQHCGSCTDETNGGLPANLAIESGSSFERGCSPRFTPAGANQESYPTAFFKVKVPRGDSLDVWMDRDATAFAVFDGTTIQCNQLLSNACDARSDCVNPPSGGCHDAETSCPPRVHRGPFPSGGSCPSCWEGGRV